MMCTMVMGYSAELNPQWDRAHQFSSAGLRSKIAVIQKGIRPLETSAQHPGPPTAPFTPGDAECPWKAR